MTEHGKSAENEMPIAATCVMDTSVPSLRAGVSKPLLADEGKRTVQQIGDLLGVPRTTIYGNLEPGSAAKRLAARKAD